MEKKLTEKEYQKLNPKQQEEHHLKVRKDLISKKLIIPCKTP